VFDLAVVMSALAFAVVIRDHSHASRPIRRIKILSKMKMRKRIRNKIGSKIMTRAVAGSRSSS